eukprot:6199578-Pleurochrysis_carterae.AAC.1
MPSSDGRRGGETAAQAGAEQQRGSRRWQEQAAKLIAALTGAFCNVVRLTVSCELSWAQAQTKDEIELCDCRARVELRSNLGDGLCCRYSIAHSSTEHVAVVNVLRTIQLTACYGMRSPDRRINLGLLAHIFSLVLASVRDSQSVFGSTHHYS